MTRHAPRLLYVTDLAYRAAGRRYADEDLELSARLRADFPLALCDPRDAARLMDGFDAVLVRNSGPVLHYRAAYAEFRAEALRRGIPVHNPLTGRADMAGKGYLVELTRAGLPVIPTYAGDTPPERLPTSGSYVVKPVDGADSVGLAHLDPVALAARTPDAGTLVQPYIPFRYEVSFTFVDGDFQYALYAPDPARRWELVPYRASAADLAFARRFVDWNALPYGIQRVDACRTREGDLLLVELEDHNPYLSLGLLDTETRTGFERALVASLRRATAHG
ncbi:MULTISPECIES: hypothetical protein [unclassified Streptomyces]|uniref:hypothetical protein n=1 Tax=unclassified Streptomyces TaxID=2593676 RepID=UPI00081EF2F0|nr:MULTISPECIES: hypothetical protein [unclassified Streptomyces]MYR28346.1 hypothetical protein [Streptomyces sp. SID4945]SCF36740.1 hypothetical protein GA0115257_113862 [Streptomyces sp. LcepLS]